MKKNILNITETENKFYLDLICVNKRRVTDIDYKDNYILDTIDSKDEIRMLSNNITDALIKTGYCGIPMLVMLNLKGLFIEKIEVPRLSQKETNKAIDLELTKLYGDYNRKYVVSMIGYSLNKEQNIIEVAMYDIELYDDIIKFLYSLNVGRLNISLSVNNFKNLLLNERLIETILDKTDIVVCICNKYTMILAIKNERVVADWIVDDCLKEYKEVEEKKLFQEYSNYDVIIQERFQKMFFETKKILAYLSKEEQINNIYICFEEDILDKEYFSYSFNKNIQYEVKLVSLKNLKVKDLLVSSALTLNTYYDFTMPLLGSSNET